MFTGIIAELGKVISIKKNSDKTTFEIQTKDILKNKKIGDSISVNGACTTITKIEKNTFTFDAIKETLEKTNLNKIKKGNEVNLESPLTLEQGLDGHLVQGHVDCTGETIKLSKIKGKTKLEIKFPQSIAKYLAFKGSITINGVSLTISDLQANTFTVDLIPHTLKNTNLKNLKKNDKVNLEIDIIARYLESLLNQKDKEAKYFYLKERNLI